jgi:hypothetical protein
VIVIESSGERGDLLTHGVNFMGQKKGASRFADKEKETGDGADDKGVDIEDPPPVLWVNPSVLKLERSFKTYQLRASMIWLLMMGPIIKPMFDAMVQKKTTQMRAWELKISSMLPPMIVPGTAERRPARTRITMAAGREWTTPITTQQTQLTPLLMMYSFLRPKDSVQGGKMMLPTDCPRRNLLWSQ